MAQDDEVSARLSKAIRGFENLSEELDQLKSDLEEGRVDPDWLKKFYRKVMDNFRVLGVSNVDDLFQHMLFVKSLQNREFAKHLNDLVGEELAAEIGFAIEFLPRSMPHYIKLLLENKLIDLERASDPKYLRTILHNNKDFIMSQFVEDGVGLRLDGNFLKNAKYAVENDDREVAIVLISTVIEHRLNMCVNDMLEDRGLSADDAEKAIGNRNIDDKIGWLMKILGNEFPDGIKRQIVKTTNLRNAIVHFKPRRWLSSIDSPTEMQKVIQQLDFDEVFRCVDELESTLESFRENSEPNYALAKKLSNVMLDFSSSPLLSDC